ncbi:IS110 family transposase [uncultured Duncaniella sp.]|uniref:IS110 family transposase n=1 Tax=uncultured Duncaniella sp. TaxID=2768039 RepID=UPI0025A95C1E|nr:IS110 family transposase [uncultured Duncaniella sp.]
MPVQSNKLNFKGQNIYIGIDVHLKSWNVCVYVGGLKIKPFSQTPSAAVLKSHLETNYPGGTYYSAYESGFCGFSVHYELLRHGINNIVFNAADISDTSKERMRKTDSTDSSKIARNLSKGELSAIHVPSEQEISDREVLRTRMTHVKMCVQTKMRIKSLLYVKGIRYPDTFEKPGTHWSRNFVSWIENEASSLPYEGGRSLLIQIENLRFIHNQILKDTRELRKIMTQPRYQDSYKLLMSIPGIGFLTAATFLLEAGDISRFASNDHLASFVGFVPDTRSTGEKDIAIGVTSRSNHRLRTMFIESAWSAIRQDPALTLAYTKLVSRMEPNKAIIRIGRKLLNRVACVLRTRKPYVKAVVL